MTRIWFALFLTCCCLLNGPNSRTVYVLCLTDITWLMQFYSHLVSKLEVVNMKTDFLNRNVNEGFSGGERKRNEILQLAVMVLLPLFLSIYKDCI